MLNSTSRTVRKPFRPLLASWFVAPLGVIAVLLAFASPIVAQDSAAQRFGRMLFGGHSPYERAHESVGKSFAQVTAKAARSTVKVLVNDAQAALGTIVDADGLIVTKASELRGSEDLVCELHDGKHLYAKQVGENEEYDLALLKIDTKGLQMAPFAVGSSTVGAWVAAPDTKGLPVSFGVVSVTPRKIPKSRALIGVRLGPNPKDPTGGALVAMVFPKGGAERAGVKVDDIIIRADGREITTPDDLISHVSGMLPGDRVKLTVRRGDEEKIMTAELLEQEAFTQSRIETQNSLGGPISRRRTGFPRVIQHDGVLRPEQCGGPLVDLDGMVVGVNIARAGRVASYAIPAADVLQVLPTMVDKMGNFADIQRRKQVAEMQSNISRIQRLVNIFEARLEKAVQERDEVDPKSTDLLDLKAKRVKTLEVRVKESRDRLKKVEEELRKLESEPVSK